MPIHILHPEITENKLQIINSELDKTYIVADFDGTLTQYFDENNKTRPSIISILRDEGILDEEYSELAKGMHSHYGAIERDETMPFDDRKKLMVERWTKHKELLMRKGLKKHHIDHISTGNYIMMRKGVDTLLTTASQHNIPVIIFSASGVGVDSISKLLEHRNLNFENIHLVSNQLYRDEAGNMIGFSQPVIHSLNKEESVIRDQKEYADIQQAIKDKQHAIILGDSLNDAAMIQDKDIGVVLRIGLCNDKVEERISGYEKVFDVVITHDDSLEEIIEKIGL